MNWGSLVLGALGLALLQGVTSRSGAAQNVGGVLGNLGKAVNWFVSPEVPAFKGQGNADNQSTSAKPTIVPAGTAQTQTTPPASSGTRSLVPTNLPNLYT